MQKLFSTLLFVLLFIVPQSQAEKKQCLKSYQLSLRIPVSFGLEIEFDLKKNPKILDDYRADKTSEQKWQRLSLEEKLQIALNKTKVTRLVKMSQAAAWLPSELRRETTGTFELSDVVFTSFSEWKKALHDSRVKYGIGAAQTHVVYNPQNVNGSLTGFVSFSGDLAQLSILERGYEKHLKDSEKIPGNNLMHFVLGPLRGEGIVNTKNYEDKIRANKKITNETGGKYFLSTVLRAGIYGNQQLAGFELRQFNFDYLGLEKEVRNTVTLLNNNSLASFKNYEEFHESNQQILERLNSQYGQVNLSWIKSLEQMSDKDKNFYFNVMALFKDWKNHPILNTLEAREHLKVRSQIIEKEGLLLTEINALFARKLSAKETQKNLRVLIAKFFYELKLSDFFKREYDRILLMEAYSNAS